ncbi:XrtA-associated tyrosine autokinase [Rheinheimera salexigens]|uniref:non-specific protein-tyrosine kinase n=1 Tax=Rheinheimera salexigens TaxID=1628148 RepID=A0A1E7Q791_9GAMM|nr:XrtA-associated tyrosine autokinase [Rheinheimera salexigens]OEY69961.1 exopolysaccharide biosynthesis protein [Rheinheimera salexigens]
MSTIEKAIDKIKQQQATAETTIERVQSTEQTPLDATSDTIDTPLDTTSDTIGIPDVANKTTRISRTTINIDLAELERKNFVSLSSERRLINEEYRVIKRKLINNAFGGLSSTLKHANLILVTSSRPGEGKTFSAINLALSIALEQDKTVLLVDSDVLRPNVSKTLEIQHEVGLTDYLQSDQVKVTDIILNTNIERLKIVTAGSPHHLSTELLASERMLLLVKEFASRYPDRLVIFDAPPLLGVNETSVMASMCGQAVIVVEENRSKLAEIEQAVSLLPKDIAIGFLINKAHRNQGKGYGYGYYYGAD